MSWQTLRDAHSVDKTVRRPQPCQYQLRGHVAEGRTLVRAPYALATPDVVATATPGEGGFVRADLRFIHNIYTAIAVSCCGTLSVTLSYGAIPAAA